MTRSTLSELEQRLRKTFAATEAVTRRWHENERSDSPHDRSIELADWDDKSSAAPTRLRRLAAPLIAAATVVVIAGVAIGLSIANSRNGNSPVAGHTPASGRSSDVASTPKSSVPTSRSEPMSVSEPAWVKRCIPSRDGQAPGYVGHTVAEIPTVAQQRGEKAIIFAADGKCLPRVAIGAPIGGPRLVALATETTPTGEQNIIYAAYVPQGE